MAEYPRAELEEMVQRWLTANKTAEDANDWGPMADLYTEDANYGWNFGPKEDFMAVGREEIREWALGTEMFGLGGWEYPYEQILIDEKVGQVIGLWRQVADAKRADGSNYEVGGIGGSWFRYGGNFQWSWQRDFFDHGNATALFIEMMGDDVLSDGMTQRMERSLREPLHGHHRIWEAPVKIWETPHD